MPLDVTQRSQCFEVADAVRREHGRIDILVNSAGGAHRSPAEEFPEERFDYIIELNLKGTYLCCQAFGNVMLAQGKGSIINMASIGSFIAYPLSSAYLASKGGVAQVTKVMALEWRERGVRVNGIGPTLMESPMTRKAAQTTSFTADHGAFTEDEAVAILVERSRGPPRDRRCAGRAPACWPGRRCPAPRRSTRCRRSAPDRPRRRAAAGDCR